MGRPDRVAAEGERVERGFDSGWIGAGVDDDLEDRLAAEEEPFDLRRPHVMTVLGAIESAALGVTLLQTHLFPPPQGLAPDPSPAVDPGHALLADLEELYAAGGRAVVGAATGDADRDVASLLWAAARAPAHVVAATGIGARSRGATPTDDTPDTNVDDLAAELVRELTVGIGGTKARAGAIVVGFRAATFGAAEEMVARSAALAHVAIGAPVIARLDRDAAAPALALLVGEGVAPERITIVPHDHDGVADWLAPIGARGVFVAIGPGNGRDPVGDGSGDVAATVASLVAAGLGDRVLLAGAVTRPSPLRAYRGPGLAVVLDRLPLLLMEAGLDALAVRRLLVDNPARALTIGTEAA